MLFLALWHGLHSGYLVCFQMEFLIVIVERQVGTPRTAGDRNCEDRSPTPLLPPQAESLIRNSPALSHLASITALQPFFYLVQQTIHWLFMGYSMTAFCLFTWDKWMKVTG